MSVIEWTHTGFGTSATRSVYHSERTALSYRGGDVPTPFADPRNPLYVDLGGGVSALVPLALFEDESGTLPHGKAPVTAKKPPRKVGKPKSTAEAALVLPATADDRATRLADVALAWTIFQHFYPYFEVVKTDWPAALESALARAATDADAVAFADTLTRLISALNDGHGWVSGVNDRTARPPITWGIVEKRLVVLTVDDDAGSAAGGVKPGDTIISIDGKAALVALGDELPLVSAATPQYAMWKALLRLAGGAQGSTLAVEVQSPGAKTSRQTTLTRTAILWEWHTEHRPEKIAEIERGIWYVDLERTTESDLDEALPKLAAAKGVIFDLRGYPIGKWQPKLLGHLSDHELASQPGEVPVITRPDRKDWTADTGGNWTVPAREPRITAKIAFLTDARAVSAAETWMGMVEAYKLGDIVGSTTAGTNGNINPFELPGGLHVIFTGMIIKKHDGSQLHGVGIAPTVPIERTIAGVTAGKDEILIAACKLVEGKK